MELQDTKSLVQMLGMLIACYSLGSVICQGWRLLVEA
jgi:hypothetical protein